MSGYLNRREALFFSGGAILSTTPLLACASAHAAPADYIFENVNIVTMRDERVLHDHAISVSAGRISAIIPQAQAGEQHARTRINCQHQFLLPALYDMHVHLEGEPLRAFPLYLANGVTTVRNMSDRDFDHLRIRREVRTGELDGPRYLTSGPSLTAANVRSGADVDAMLERHVRAGYDLMKIHGDLDPALYIDLVSGARARGLKVSGHVQREGTLEQALQLDSIEHAEEFLHVPGRAALADPVAAARAADIIAASGIAVCPTLFVFGMIRTYLEDGRFAALRDDPTLRYLPEPRREEWLSSRNQYRRNITRPTAIDWLRESETLLGNFTNLLHARGVPLLLGTDALGAMTPGFSAHRELAALVNVGLSPYQALFTATAAPARYLGEAHERGSIEVGKLSEFILVSRNPLADVGNAADVTGVFTRGRWRDSLVLRDMLAAVETLPYTTDAYRLN